MDDANYDFWSPTFLPSSTIQEAVAFKHTHLGLLTQRKGPPALFSELVVRLQMLALSDETEPALAEVDAALNCPWWGIRVVAIRAFGSWAGPGSMARLDQIRTQSYYTDKEQIWFSFASSYAASAKRLFKTTPDKFARWAGTFGIDLYPPLLSALPLETAQHLLARVLQEVRDGRRINLTIRVANRRSWPLRAQVLETVSKGSDKASQIARNALIDDDPQPSAMSVAEFRAAMKVLGLSCYLEAAQNVSPKTISLWSAGELPVPNRVARWLRAQVEKRVF